MTDHTAGHYLDKAKAVWLQNRADLQHTRSQLDMAAARIKRWQPLLERLAADDVPGYSGEAAELLQ